MKTKLILIFIIVLAFFLRFYKLDSNPPGLYWDEAVLGYDAYSILKTGRDHHGTILPLFFESFGDWKLPVYHYLLVPSIAVFGLNEFAVRFPSAFFGSLTIFIFFLLINKLTKNQFLSLTCAFLLAISPWHTQFSRGGFESNPGLFFLILGVYLFIIGLGKMRILLFSFSFLFFIFSMYSYHAYRIFTPLIMASLIIIYYVEIKKNLIKVALTAFIAFILCLPLTIFTISNNGKARAISQTIFDKQAYEKKRIEYDLSSKRPLRFLSKYWSKSIYYTYLTTNVYLDHFSPVFLFFKGDQIGRHSLVETGQIFGFEIILLSASLLAFKTLNYKLKFIMLAWLLLSPIPASIVTPTPHANRTLQMSLPLAFFSASGLYYLFTQRFLLLKIGLIFIISYSLLTYWHLRFVHYPRVFAADWQDGYRQMVKSIKQYDHQYNKIFITDLNQAPYIYLLFYEKYDPNRYLLEGGSQNSFGKYFFVSRDTNVYNNGRILYVAPFWEQVKGYLITEINDTNGKHIYSLWGINE